MAEDDLRNPVRREYPFSAVVGCERQKNALRCALASPDITSVLISGAKGTGKTVLARSITSICGDRRVITLPLGSTEDMVFGGIDLEVALKGGKRVVT
ncbi:MAG: ATP-binding protein, partial [Candidatus Methanomethylophilaceae archaeon]